MNNKLAFSAFAVLALAVAVVAADGPAPRAQVADEDNFDFGVDAGSNEVPVEEPETKDLDIGGTPPCPATKKGGGFGGNSVTCRFPCTQYDIVTIQVDSADNVYVWGSGTCGGTTANCHGTQTCTGVSRKWATQSSLNGACEGHSDETWKSALTVDCSAAPGCTSPVWCMENANPSTEPDGEEPDPA